jgi:hypothetical protein
MFFRALGTDHQIDFPVAELFASVRARWTVGTVDDRTVSTPCPDAPRLRAGAPDGSCAR